MAPHPTPQMLMRETNLYDLELQYRKEMQRLPQLDFLGFFVGKKMRIDGRVYLLEREKEGNEGEVKTGVRKEPGFIECGPRSS